MPLRPEPARAILLLPLLAVWVALALLGFPAPSIDDLIYGGPAVHLALGKGLSNSWIHMLAPVDHRFLIYPPLYFPILGLWLKIVGISTRSLLLFQTLSAFVTSVVVWLFLRRWNASPWLLLLWTALMAAFVGISGFRPDLCALALFALGLWLEETSRKETPFAIRLLGTFLLVAAIQTLPALVVAVAVFFLYPLLVLPADERLSLLLRLALAGILNLFLFLAVIDFRVASFVHDFRVCEVYTTRMYADFYAAMWHSPSALLRVAVLPGCFLLTGLALAPLEFGAASTPDKRRFLRIAALSLFLLVALCLPIFTCSVSIGRILGLQCAFGTALLAWAGYRRRKSLLWSILPVVAALLFIATYGRGLIEWASVPRPDGPRLEPLRQSVNRLLDPHAPPIDIVIVDPVSARLVFDYRLPPGTRDNTWNFTWENPRIGPPPVPDLGVELQVLSPQEFVYRPAPAGIPDEARPVPIRLFGRTIPRTAANRNDLFLIGPRPVE